MADIATDGSETIARATPVVKPQREGCADLVTVGVASTDVWSDLMIRDPEAVPYQSPEWAAAACATGGFQNVSRYYETRSGARFVMPMIRRRGVPAMLATAGSMPDGWGMGGLVGSEPPTSDVARAVIADLQEAGFQSIHLRPNPRQAHIWAKAMPERAVVMPRRAHMIDLTGGYDPIWNGVVSRKLRRNVRRAGRLVEVEFGTGDRLMPLYCRLVESARRRWARLQNEPLALTKLRAWMVEPTEKYTTIARVMGENCRVGVAYVGGRPAAATVVLRGGNVNCSRVAMDIDLVGSTGANDLLQKLIIDDAVRAGCRFYHLGESGRSSSLARFKEKFGAVAYDYAEYRLETIPLKRFDLAARSVVKRLIGFKDAS
ncbi:GNAT family N-acetyltransferase [Devosia sp.]|uniref:GNAT family N-acetyltransferase n=1 Tax=Devosia sp. TaxID=1871048 RepID=UPI003A8D68C6